MAQKTFRGDAIALKQQEDRTLSGTWEAVDKVNIAVGGKTVTIVVGSTSISTIIDNVVAAFNALDTGIYPDFAGEFTASKDGTTTLRFEADTAGVPFTVTVTVTDVNVAADPPAISAATVNQASKGPNHYDDATNWDPAGVPANGDDIDIARSNVSILYGLDQSAVTPNTVEMPASYSGLVGNKDFNDSGYWEYRTKQLTFAAVTNGWKIGHGPGPGSSRIRAKVTAGGGGTATTFDIAGSAQPEVEGIKSIQIETGAAANVVNITKGSVEVAGQDGQSATLTTLRVGYQQNQASDADVLTGEGCVLTTIEKSGGRLETNANITTLNQTEGAAGDTLIQAGALTTLTGRGGRVIYNSTGALATANLGGTVLLDFSQDPRPKTITNPVEVSSQDAHVYDPHNVVNVGGSLIQDFNNVEVEINGTRVGTNIRLTRAATA